MNSSWLGKMFALCYGLFWLPYPTCWSPATAVSESDQTDLEEPEDKKLANKEEVRKTNQTLLGRQLALWETGIIDSFLTEIQLHDKFCTSK